MENNWYTEAIIYAIDVGKFADSDGDGIGDFKGLSSRIPYLAELGITCIWLLPCYPTEGRDNGYDVTEYYNIHAQHGTLDDFLEVLHRAGEHGIRVIMDLVVTHTSDRHPWFQAARHDEQSRYRNYYIWSHHPPPIRPGEGSIFPGQEETIWTYDELARAFYYHRFYAFEPGLNIGNPEVREEIFRIIDFWLSFGIAGFRLDAAAHMIEQKAQDERQQQGPYEVLQNIYGYMRSRRPHALLLAEVDEDPLKLKDYFGEGDQLGLLYNFLLNNYMFLALARGEGEPLARGMKLLPQPPEGCGWANFLRNLDELDLERLSQEDRDEVMQAFAPKEDMRIYGRGIRRRLAPMLEGDKRRIALAFSLLFSLPGTPMIVYGDEIGMGDDLSRPGRQAVRPVMQWSDEKNGGFSTAESNALPQTPINDGEYSYRRVNVAAQRDDPDSLLQQVRWLIQQRRQYRTLTTARFKMLETGAPAAFGHCYDTVDEILVMLHNLRNRRCSVSIDLGRPVWLVDLATREKLECGNGSKIPLDPYGYRWLRVIEP